MKKVKEEKAHAVYGPSSAERWTSCYASIQHCESAPPERESPYAQEGTDAHTCFEIFLKNGIGKYSEVYDLLAQSYPEEMVCHALEAANEIWARAPIDAKIVAEQKVDISEFTDDDQFGTLDCAIIEEFGKLAIWDFKYGAGIPVDCEGNLQLILYALGVAKQYDYNFSEVELGVIQPRAAHHTGQTVRSWTITMAELLEYKPFFLNAVKKTKEKNPEFRAGDHCRFCRGRVNCPAISKHAIEQAQIAFDDDTSEIIAVPDPRLIPVKNLSSTLDACDKLEQWIGAVREFANFALERGHAVEGYKLVPRKASRKWADEKKAMNLAMAKFGLEALEPKSLLSPAKFEKHLGEIYDEKTVKKFVSTHATSISSGLTMVKEDDPRTAVNPAARAFDEVPLTEKTKKKGNRK